MILAVLNTCDYIIYKNCVNVIICEEMFLFKISLLTLVTQLGIYAGKNHVRLFSDKFRSEGNLSSYTKLRQLSVYDLNPIYATNVFIDLWYTRDIQCNLTQRQSVLTIAIRNFFTVSLYEFYQCTRIDSYKCLCMINIIESEFTSFGN